MRRAIFVFLCIATAISAFTTFSYFDNFPALTAGRRGPPLANYFILLVNILFVSAPIILIAAVISPVRALIIACSIHAATFVSFLTITSITFRPGHSSFGDSVAPVILTGFWLICAVEFAMIFVALGRSRELGAGAAFLSTFACLAAPVVGGWVIGVLVWSETLPAKVITSAETTAGSRRYCIEAGGSEVDSRRDLVAWSMLSPNGGGFRPYFHAVMAIGGGSGTTYANWSYRQGRFVPVSERSRAALHLDRSVNCVPTEHFRLRL